MRTASREYSFSKTELQILKEIARGNYELSSIQAALSIKPSLISFNIKKLQKKGLIKTTQKVNKKQLYYGDAKHAALLSDLFSIYSHVDWENILSGKAIEILFQTYSSSAKNITNIPKTTQWRHLKNLKTRGIITQNGMINPKFRLLTEFLREYQMFYAKKLASTISGNSIILWQKDMEFLVRAPKGAKPTPKDLQKTATSIFSQHNLPLFTEFEIYFYSPNKKSIKPEDAILHTLLVEPNNMRYTTFALLLLKKTEKRADKEYLLNEAERLGLKNQIIGMLQFLETHTRPEGQPLPTWSEFATKASDYAVIA